MPTCQGTPLHKFTAIGSKGLRRVRERVAPLVLAKALSEERMARWRPEGQEAIKSHISD